MPAYACLSFCPSLRSADVPLFIAINEVYLICEGSRHSSSSRLFYGIRHLWLHPHLGSSKEAEEEWSTLIATSFIAVLFVPLFFDLFLCSFFSPHTCRCSLLETLCVFFPFIFCKNVAVITRNPVERNWEYKISCVGRIFPIASILLSIVGWRRGDEREKILDCYLCELSLRPYLSPL